MKIKNGKKIELSDILKSRRKALNLTIRGLANDCEVSKYIIQRVESGVENYTVDTLIKICNRLNLKIDIHE